MSILDNIKNAKAQKAMENSPFTQKILSIVLPEHPYYIGISEFGVYWSNNIGQSEKSIRFADYGYRNLHTATFIDWYNNEITHLEDIFCSKGGYIKKGFPYDSDISAFQYTVLCSPDSPILNPVKKKDW